MSFSNSSDAEYRTSNSRRDIPQILTIRPKNTYYRGLYLDGDVQSKELPMRSEIAVVSTVRLIFGAIRQSAQLGWQGYHWPTPAPNRTRIIVTKYLCSGSPAQQTREEYATMLWAATEKPLMASLRNGP